MNFEETCKMVGDRIKAEETEAWKKCEAELLKLLNQPDINVPASIQEPIIELCHTCFISGYTRGTYNTTKSLLKDLGFEHIFKLVETQIDALYNKKIPIVPPNPSLN